MAATGGKKKPDYVLRLLVDEFYLSDRGFSTEDFYTACSVVAGIPLNDFFAAYAQGTGEFPYQDIVVLCNNYLHTRYQPGSEYLTAVPMGKKVNWDRFFRDSAGIPWKDKWIADILSVLE